MFTINATSNDQGRVLFKVVKEYLNNVPISRIEKLFREKDIKVNGIRTNDKKLSVSEGDLILIYGIEAGKKRQAFIKNVEVKFNVIFEDENILIVNKPYNVDMHDSTNSLDNQVLKYLKFVKIDSFVPSSIGRLDKKTTGLVCYAKSYNALRTLKQQENIKKVYLYKSNIPFLEEGEIKTVTFHHFYNPERQRAELFNEAKGNTKEATTILYDKAPHHYAELVTGRKHQIRVTLSKLGYPIFGDVNYGGKKDKRVYLHSHLIKFHDLKDELEYLNDLEFIDFPKW
ncbi:pseudouridine synthase [Mycoplasmopsis agassizii]|uniref:pseudouridine synthase n=1 Tax=Mycoplasmopsis agassizii TaxID=33922 RepID=UPI0035290C02